MLKKSARETRDPAKAKTLRLAHDRVNAYGENDKGSRKSIRRFKLDTVRSNRRLADAAVRNVPCDDDPRGDASLADAVYKAGHPVRQKVADVPKGLLIATKKRLPMSTTVRDNIVGLWIDPDIKVVTNPARTTKKGG